MTTNRMGLEQTLSDDNLKDLSAFLMESYTGALDTLRYAYAAEAINELLAYRKASKEPMAPFGYVHQRDHFFTNDHGNIYKTPGGNFTRPLYSAPPLQAVTVPYEMTPIAMRDFAATNWAVALDDDEANIAADGWNACRAATLKQNDK